jgi:glycosyltransferase involved in cell wall biosynthesis
MKIAIIVTDNRDDLRRYSDPHPYFGTAPSALIQGFEKIRDVEIHIVSCVQQSVASPPSIGKNIFYHSLYVPKWGWLRGGYVGCILAVRRKLQQIQPDIVHGQGTERYCSLSAIFSGFPNVVTIHGNMRLMAQLKNAIPFSFLWCAAKLERLTLPKTGGVVCISRHTQSLVSALQKKTWVIPNAVNEKYFQVHRQKPLEPEFLCVGTIDSCKNQIGLIKALDKLPEKKFKIRFFGRIHEGASYDQEFLTIVKERPWCSYEGFADRDHLLQVYTGSTALIHPSLEENCPMVVLEAMAIGLPVLAATVGGIPDLIRDRENGLLFNPHHPDQITKVVFEALQDPSLLEKMAANARLNAEKYYHPVRIAERHLDVYREALNKS